MAAAQSGQVLLFAVVQQGSTLDVFHTIDFVMGSLRAHGELFAFIRLSASLDGSFRAVAEFCNTSAALAAVRTSASTHSSEVVPPRGPVTLFSF